MSAPRSVGLVLGLVIYAVAAVFSAREVGVVGETDIGWALARPPDVSVGWSGGVTTLLPAMGPFEARDTRPSEVLRLGEAYVPIAINDYTGGLADWPARVVRSLTGARSGGVAVHLVLGAMLLYLAHRFLRFHGTTTAAGAVALLLASDWVFVFFKRVLGGTEILLQAAGLLVLWSLWSRRWKGGQHGTIAIAVGVGLGLQAKITFAATLSAFAAAALLTRWDRPKLKPPESVHLSWLVGIVGLCIAPLLLALIHRLEEWSPLAASQHPHAVSHDRLDLQWSRLSQGVVMGRESIMNVARFFGNPLGWLADAWATDRRPTFDSVRFLGHGFVGWGTTLEWRRRTSSPSAALLRFLSIAVPFQIGFLTLLNGDLHHLAQATVPFALWGALALDRVAANFAPPRSVLRALVLGTLCLPAMISGVRSLAATDSVVRTARAHLFSRNGQDELRQLLDSSKAKRIVTTSYELYGMAEQLVPGVQFDHRWAAVSRGDRSVAGLRAVVGCDHYLSVRGSAPFIYDWRAEGIGREVASLHDRTGAWAILYEGECIPGARTRATP